MRKPEDPEVKTTQSQGEPKIAEYFYNLDYYDLELSLEFADIHGLDEELHTILCSSSHILADTGVTEMLLITLWEGWE